MTTETVLISHQDTMEKFNSTTASELLKQVTELVTKNSEQDEIVERGLISWDDATWILTSAFIIFTMQSGNVNKCYIRLLQI